MNDGIRSGQVQTVTACTQRDQEHRDAAFIEGFGQRHALLRRRAAVQIERFDAAFAQVVADNAQHRSEL